MKSGRGRSRRDASALAQKLSSGVRLVLKVGEDAFLTFDQSRKARQVHPLVASGRGLTRVSSGRSETRRRVRLGCRSRFPGSSYARGRKVFLRSLDSLGSRRRGSSRSIAADIESGRLTAPDGRRALRPRDQNGEIRLWSTATRAVRPLRVLKGANATWMRLASIPRGRWLAGVCEAGATAHSRLGSDRSCPVPSPSPCAGADSPGAGNGLAFESERSVAAPAANCDGPGPSGPSARPIPTSFSRTKS